ncbi:protein FAM161B isoform X2 [Arapaima gigas]
MLYFNKAKNTPSREEEQRNSGSAPHSAGAKQGFPLKDTETDSDGDLKVRPTEDLEAVFQPRRKSPPVMELHLQHRLQVLREAYEHQLQETGLQHQLELDRRVLHDSLLSTAIKRQTRSFGDLERHLPSRGRKNTIADANSMASRFGRLKHSSSLSDLQSEKKDGCKTFSQQRNDRSFTASATRFSSVTIPQPFHMTLRDAQKKLQVPLVPESFLEQKRKLEEIECQKKFHATPVPAHVFLPLYHNITEAKEQARKAGLEQRRELLLSMQKPFRFMVREKKKREEIMHLVDDPESQTQTKKSLKVRTSIPKTVMDPGVGERLIEQELHRKIRIQMRAQDLLKSSVAPIKTQPNRGTLEMSSTQQVRRKVLGFLDEKPNFKPCTNPNVPDFERLHRAFQKKASRRAEHKEVTRCQPFQLLTSKIPPRESGKTEVLQALVSNPCMKRSHSFGDITSLSANTLPTYITDAARRRSSAIRRSLEEKEHKEQENVEWIKQHTMKSQAIRKTVTTRARAMDPHKSLKEVLKEKLKQNRELDNQRMKDYRKELMEMKTRVSVRPYLFEQTNAKQDAERRYRSTLQQAGLDEHFVRRKGEKAKAVSPVTPDEQDDSDRNIDSWKDTKENKPAEEENENTEVEQVQH